MKKLAKSQNYERYTKFCQYTGNELMPEEQRDFITQWMRVVLLRPRKIDDANLSYFLNVEESEGYRLARLRGEKIDKN